MEKKSILFLHANGFPSQMYQPSLKFIKNSELFYIEKLAHHKGQDLSTWFSIVHEVQIFIDTNLKGKKLIGIGHSLGGVLIYMLAHRNPELFEKIILLDSPIMNTTFSFFIYFLKITGLISYFTPAHRTLNRTEHFITREEAYTHFQNKKVFKYFTHESLQHYINFGLRKSENGFVLNFEKLVEYQIYKSIPHITHRIIVENNIEKHLIYGKYSKVFNRFILKNMKKQNFRLTEVDGSHLFPFENPQMIGKKLNEFISM